LESSRPEFWSERYVTGRTPWRTNKVPQQLAAFLESRPASQQVLVPGCGDDDRAMRAFQSAGHNVTAIDFSPPAIALTKNALPDMTERIILGDFFDCKLEGFDVVYERTFLCSLPPTFWHRYAEKVASVLKPGGLLAEFFIYGEEPEPPPYPLTDATAGELFRRDFELARSETVEDSLPLFVGMERWQEWRRT